MNLRGSVRKALEPVVGRHGVDNLVETERRWRRAIAAGIAPKAPVVPDAIELAPSGYPVYPIMTPRFPAPTLTRHEFMTELHRSLEPRTYLEIGVDDGRSLALSHAKSIGIDPAFHVTHPLRADLLLARATSDEFFAGTEAAEHLDGAVIDLAFIDGLHLAEFAYRDFVNVERLCGRGSVIVLDDMLPRIVDEAARDRYTDSWAGDVFKLIGILRAHRPDLVVVPVNTFPTGVIVILGLDPASKVLSDAYESLLPELTSGDPQTIPAEILERSNAVDGRDVVAWPGWSALRATREKRTTRPQFARIAAEFAQAFAGGGVGQ